MKKKNTLITADTRPTLRKPRTLKQFEHFLRMQDRRARQNLRKPHLPGARVRTTW